MMTSVFSLQSPELSDAHSALASPAVSASHLVYSAAVVHQHPAASLQDLKAHSECQTVSVNVSQYQYLSMFVTWLFSLSLSLSLACKPSELSLRSIASMTT
jgi:hypothetical protein